MAEHHGLSLWNKLEQTDPAATKRFDNGAFKGTAVDAVYNIKRVTEQLGPVGFAWGWHIVSERLDRFGSDQNEQVIHTAVVRAWFRQEDGGVREVEQVGQTVAARWTGRNDSQRRFMVDGDHAKKSVTDALSKIMLSLGTSADVWMGRFDGSKYAELSKGFVADEEPVNDPPKSKPEAPAPADLVIAGAQRALAKLPGMDAAGIEAVRGWLKQTPGDDGVSHWQLLGQRNKQLRDELVAAMGERVKALEVASPSPAPRDENPEQAVQRALSEQDKRRQATRKPALTAYQQKLVDDVEDWIAFLAQADEAGLRQVDDWLNERDANGGESRWLDLAVDERARTKLARAIDAAAARLGLDRAAE